MLELKGKYNTAKVFTDNVDNETISQVIELLNQDYINDARIRIMPDCHAGAGCVIGTTMTISDKVCPNLVGVDIGFFVSGIYKDRRKYRSFTPGGKELFCHYEMIGNESEVNYGEEN